MKYLSMQAVWNLNVCFNKKTNLPSKIPSAVKLYDIQTY